MTTPEQPRHDEHGRPAGGVRGAINDLLGRGDHTDDDRRVEDKRLAPEHADAGPAVDPRPGQQPPTGARFEGQPAPQHGDGVVGAAAPQQHGVGDRRPDDLFDAPATPGGARHSDVGPGGPGYADPAAQPRSARPGDAQPARAQPGTGRPDPGADAGRAGDPGAAGNASASTRPVATTATGSGAGGVAGTSQGEDADGRERLVPTDRATSYASRWDAVKGEFVDEPRKAVADADALVGELLSELQTLFTEQRRGIEHGLTSDETSTEDMRLALRRYRSFFDRLLSI